LKIASLRRTKIWNCNQLKGREVKSGWTKGGGPTHPGRSLRGISQQFGEIVQRDSSSLSGRVGYEGEQRDEEGLKTMGPLSRW